MLNKFLALLTVGMVAALSTSAQAGLLETIAPFDGAVDELWDNSRSVVYRGGTLIQSGPLAVGDVIVGIIRIDQRVNPNPAGALNVDDDDHLVGVFSVTIGTPFVQDGVTIFPNSATAAASSLSLKSLIGDTHYSGMNLTGSTTEIDDTAAFNSFWGSAAIAVFEKMNAPDPTGIDNPMVSGEGLSIIQSVTQNGSGWNLRAIAGFGDSNDFLHTTSVGVGTGNTLIQNGNFALSERAGLSILAHDLGAGVQFLDVQSERFVGSDTLHDLVIVATTNITKATSNDWSLNDRATLRINIVPEPGSMTLLGLGLLGLAGAGYRQRRKSARIDA